MDKNQKPKPPKSQRHKLWELKNILRERTENLDGLRLHVATEEQKVIWLQGMVAALERDLPEEEEERGTNGVQDQEII